MGLATHRYLKRRHSSYSVSVASGKRCPRCKPDTARIRTPVVLPAVPVLLSLADKHSHLCRVLVLGACLSFSVRKCYSPPQSPTQKSVKGRGSAYPHTVTPPFHLAPLRGRFRIISFITEPRTIRRILEHLDEQNPRPALRPPSISTTIPPRARASIPTPSHSFHRASCVQLSNLNH